MRNVQTRNPIAGVAFQTFVQEKVGDKFYWKTRFITPDPKDIRNFNCSLAMDSVGSFSITLDNKEQQFFRSDELEELSNGKSALEDFSSKKTSTVINGEPIPTKDLFTKFGGDWTRGDCYFRPMMIVKIFARNHFLYSDSTNITDIFTGIISSVSDKFSNGVYEVILQGESVLKWLQLSNALVDPALASLQNQEEGISAGYPQGYFDSRDLFTTRYASMTPEEILKELILGRILPDRVDEEGNPVRVAGIATYSLEDQTEDERSRATKNIYDRIFIRREHDGLNELFNERKLHIHPIDSEIDGISRITAYATFLRRSLPAVTGAEFRNRLSLCQDTARAIYWEFYTDGDGDLWFHPPLVDIQRFLLNKHPEVYVLDDDSRISWDITKSDRSIITRTVVTPEIDMVTFNLSLQNLAFTNFYEDRARIPLYGRRTEEIKTPLVKNFEEAGQFAEVLQTRKNVREEVTASVTLPLRAELRLGRPFYIPQRNWMFNIHSVSHSYNIAGQAQTTLGLNYGRKPWRDLEEILGFEVKSEAEIEALKISQSKTAEGKT